MDQQQGGKKNLALNQLQLILRKSFACFKQNFSLRNNLKRRENKQKKKQQKQLQVRDTELQLVPCILKEPLNLGHKAIFIRRRFQSIADMLQHTLSASLDLDEKVPLLIPSSPGNLLRGTLIYLGSPQRQRILSWR